MSITIEQDLKEVLTSINQKLDNLQKDVTDIKIEIATLQGEVRGNLKSLDEKVTTLDKRIEKIENSQKNKICALIGILGTALLGTVGRFVLTAIPPNSF
ncbi:hypothetical protein [Aphanothece sacrum]|uniref:Uncharacterized protein n=1 Tax=Aphanothece sacrum FPU1 TaxID=1920663 RepID=A0A401IF88_APHSA|nr:hypothetical protein [Aphanothece sacrum]GBF79869.1 hypothetical protein AsFPU1_1269 [Aphanothece sacrum FPU1]GBF83911.1 hypothetical protein AsFPU3_0955 [Aphanothece sacrum FPU3]